MIPRHETIADKTNIWSALAAPLDATYSDGDAEVVVRQRLDFVVVGEWDFTLDLLPNGVDGPSFKARVQILGVIREGVGTGTTYVKAARAAFLAASRMFGIVPVLVPAGA